MCGLLWCMSTNCLRNAWLLDCMLHSTWLVAKVFWIFLYVWILDSIVLNWLKWLCMENLVLEYWLLGVILSCHIVPKWLGGFFWSGQKQGKYFSKSRHFFCSEMDFGTLKIVTSIKIPKLWVNILKFINLVPMGLSLKELGIFRGFFCNSHKKRGRGLNRNT
jgi:hypothetical protein